MRWRAAPRGRRSRSSILSRAGAVLTCACFVLLGLLSSSALADDPAPTATVTTDSTPAATVPQPDPAPVPAPKPALVTVTLHRKPTPAPASRAVGSYAPLAEENCHRPPRIDPRRHGRGSEEHARNRNQRENDRKHRRVRGVWHGEGARCFGASGSRNRSARRGGGVVHTNVVHRSRLWPVPRERLRPSSDP